jgi:hypothetical protein
VGLRKEEFYLGPLMLTVIVPPLYWGVGFAFIWLEVPPAEAWAILLSKGAALIGLGAFMDYAYRDDLREWAGP